MLLHFYAGRNYIEPALKKAETNGFPVFSPPVPSRAGVWGMKFIFHTVKDAIPNTSALLNLLLVSVRAGKLCPIEMCNKLAVRR